MPRGVFKRKPKLRRKIKVAPVLPTNQNTMTQEQTDAFQAVCNQFQITFKVTIVPVAETTVEFTPVVV